MGALTGAAVGAFSVTQGSEVFKTGLINEQNERLKKAGYLADMNPGEEAAFIKALKIAFIATHASGGGATGLKYATDVNANNSAVKRGNSPKSGVRRFAEASVTGAAGFLVGDLASGKAVLLSQLPARFGTGKHRPAAWAKLTHRYV